MCILKTSYRAVLVIISLFFSCSGVSITSFSPDGTWYLMPIQSIDMNKVKEKEFGWGKGLIIPNSFLEIDSINKTIYIPGLFLLDIVKIEEITTKEFIIEALFKNGNFNVKFTIHILDKDTMWMDYSGLGEFGGDVGPDKPYFRISGPK